MLTNVGRATAKPSIMWKMVSMFAPAVTAAHFSEPIPSKQNITQKPADRPHTISATTSATKRKSWRVSLKHAAPNDFLELGNHADFLDVMPSYEMLMRFFINDTMKAGGYRLKKHADKGPFWEWVTSWAACLSNPRDLGHEYAMDGYDLPALHIHNEWVGTSDETVKRAWSEGRPFGKKSRNWEAISNQFNKLWTSIPYWEWDTIETNPPMKSLDWKAINEWYHSKGMYGAVTIPPDDEPLDSSSE